MTNEQVKELIAKHFDDADITVEGDGSHYNALIISSVFEGKNTLQRQREVFAIVGEYINSGEIHAFNMKLYTPTEWSK